MSKRPSASKPSSRQTKSPSTIELGTGPILAGFAILALIAAAFWWFGLRGRGPTAAPSSPPTSVATSANPATPASGQPQGTAGAIGSDDPDAGAWTTPEGHPALGDQGAPVTIVVYSDYQCPNCRQFAREIVPWLRTSWMARGFVRLVYRDFVLRGEGSQRAAEAAQCAGEQGHFWRYHDLLFDSQPAEESTGAFAEATLTELAGVAGLDPKAFGTCLVEHRFKDRVDASTKTATDQHFSGTPTYLVNGRKTQGAIPVAQWDQLFGLFQRDLAGKATP